MIIYSSDFSTDPNWTTDQAENFYWDRVMGAFVARTENEVPDYSPNRYAFEKINLDVSQSFSVSWDQQILERSGYAISHFGLFSDALITSGVTYIHVPNIIPESTINSGLGGWLGSQYSVFNLYTGDHIGAGGDSSGGTSSGSEIGIWYSNSLTYDADASEATWELSYRDTSEVIWERTAQVTGDFSERMTKLAIANNPIGYHPQLVWAIDPTDYQITAYDNIVVIGEPLDPSLSIELVSVASDGTLGNGPSGQPVISDDGRFVAFRSAASNLVPGDTNSAWDIFVFDRETGLTERVSLGNSGAEISLGSDALPSISGDGRFVGFWTESPELTPGDSPDPHVFIRDRLAGTTEHAIVVGSWTNPDGIYSISADGRYVALESSGAVEGVVVYDRVTATTARVAPSDGTQGTGFGARPAISPDGRYVAFTSINADLVADDHNAASDVFVHDRHTGITERISVSSDGEEANGFSGTSPGAVSRDGRYVVFESLASNLVEGDTNNANDIFVHDRLTGSTERVSVASDGTQADSASSEFGLAATISADGRFVVFDSSATNLVEGDTNNRHDIFVHDRSSGVTARVSVAIDGTQANHHSQLGGSISADGRFITFNSLASNLVSGDLNEEEDVFVASNPLFDSEPSGWSISPQGVAFDESVGADPGAVFTVTRPSSEIGTAATVYVSTTQDHGSVNDGDYVAKLHEPLTFAAGEASKTVTISLIDDDIAEEEHELFGLIVQANASDPVDVRLASTLFGIGDNDAVAPQLSGSLVGNILELAAAAYPDGSGKPNTAAAEALGWVPINLRGGPSHSEVRDVTGLDSVLTFHEGIIDGKRTLALAFSGTMFEGNDPASALDFITQAGRWDEIYAEHKEAILAVLRWAAGQASVEHPFDEMIVTGHSLGGILAEVLLADPELAGNPLVDRAHGVTFGSPGSPQDGVPADRILNFVNLGDPVAMLHRGDFFSLGVDAPFLHRLAVGAAEAFFTITGAVANPLAAAEEFVGESFAPEREGTTVTMVREQGIDLSLLGFASHGIGEADGFGYRDAIDRLNEDYGGAVRDGFDDLAFWRDLGSAWYPVGDLEDHEMVIAALKGGVLGTLNFTVFPTLRAVVGFNEAGGAEIADIADASIEVVSEIAEGVIRASSAVGTFVTGTLEALGQGIGSIADYAEVLYLGTSFLGRNVSLREGSAILEIDLGLDGTIEATTTIEGDYDLSRFFVMPDPLGTRIVYSVAAQLAATEGADLLIGSNASDSIEALAGDDLIFSASGDDMILPGLGADWIEAGSGADAVVGSLAELDETRITDLTEEDRIVVSDLTAADLRVSARQSTELLALLEIEGPNGGRAIISLDGSLVDRSLRATDIAGGVAISYATNAAPDAVDDQGAGFETLANQAFTTANVLTNDTDPDSDPLSVAELDTGSTAGLVSDNGDGTFGYDPADAFDHLAAGETAFDSFTYTVSDGAGGLDTATVRVTVTGVDDTAPTVAIDQAATQADPATDGAIVFDVVFSEEVTGFQSGDVTLAGTAGATTVTVSGSGAGYTVSVNGMTGPGTVVASIAAGVATDAAGNASLASTSTDNTVTYAPEPAPIVITGTRRGELLRGTEASEIFSPLQGVDTVRAGGGDDVILASRNDGLDFYFGDAGSDTVDYSALTRGVRVHLGELFGIGVGGAAGAQSGVDTLVSVENVIGSRAGDTIRGNGLANILDGSAGNDTLTGGAGPDLFAFGSGFGHDRITDFDANPAGAQDRIDLRGLGIGSAAFAESVEIMDLGSRTKIIVDDAGSILLAGVSGNGSNVIDVSDFFLL